MRPKLLRRFAVTLIISLMIASPALADPDDLSETEERSAKVASMPVHTLLSPAGRQLANSLGVLPQLQKLQELKEHHRKKQGEISHLNASLRLELSETILTTMLQCQQVIVEIDSEISESSEFIAAMGARRDRAIQYNTLAALVANGLVSTAGNFLQMPPNMSQIPGDTMEAGASMLSGSLGAMAMYQQNGDKLSAGIRPNMLAKVFKRPNNEWTEYPDIIWTYLNTVPAGSNQSKTRREILIDTWEKLGRIPSQSDSKGRTYVRILSGTIPQRRTVTISMLEDRSAMLADLRAIVGQIYKDLLNLMLVVRAL